MTSSRERVLGLVRRGESRPAKPLFTVCIPPGGTVTLSGEGLAAGDHHAAKDDGQPTSFLAVAA